MASESGDAHAAISHGKGPASFPAGGDQVHDLAAVFRSLPSRAAAHLLSLGVCIRCILRLLWVQGHIFSSYSLSTSTFSPIIEELTNLDRKFLDDRFSICEDTTNSKISQESEAKSGHCCICLGILQFSYCDDEEVLVRKGCAGGLVQSIAEFVNKEGHQMDKFSLEVSIPPVVGANEEIIWSYMTRKYEAEPWFQENALLERLSVKDTLKLSITNSLEKLLGVDSGNGSLRIRLTYTHTKASMKVHNCLDTCQCCKRRKTATEMQYDDEGSERVQLLPKMVNGACHLICLCYRTPVYIGGRYLKYSRNVSQTRWIIDDERKGETSVEEVIGSNVLSLCHGDDYKFQAAGREDIDVRVLGSGRPFLLQIQNARILLSEVLVKEMERKINNLETNLVKVKNLRILGSESRSLMQEGEAEKQKQYTALVWISRPLVDGDLQTLSTMKNMGILQRTPIRVLHRRSLLERERIVHWMRIERIIGTSQYFLLHLCTQAGTYIKEFVHGDLGRCHPSIGSILGCRSEIVQLDVTDVKMDSFL